jgi:hypothetical protein
MFTFKETIKYNSTIAQFCEEINVGRNLFINWLIAKGIFDEFNNPTSQYSNYFISYFSPYGNKVGKWSYSITDDGKEFIKSLLTPHDLLKMPRCKNASHRHQSNYKYYRDNDVYKDVKITINWE